MGGASGKKSGITTGGGGVSTTRLIMLTVKVKDFVTEASYNFYCIFRTKTYSPASIGSSVFTYNYSYPVESVT